MSTLAAVDGFAETFSWFIMGVAPGGGSEKPELDPAAEGVLFVVEGELTLAGERYRILPGGQAFMPPGSDWQVHSESGSSVHFHWIRKGYEFVEVGGFSLRRGPAMEHGFYVLKARRSIPQLGFGRGR